MRAAMDEMFVGDDIAVRRITRYLARLGEVVHELVEVYERVRSDAFYRFVWPWFRGQDDLEGRRNGGRDGTGVRTRCWRSRKISLGRVQVSALIHALDMILRPDDDRVHTLTSTSTLVHSTLGCFSAVCKCTYWGITALTPHQREPTTRPSTRRRERPS